MAQPDMNENELDPIEIAFESYWETVQPPVKEFYRQFFINGANAGVVESIALIKGEKG